MRWIVKAEVRDGLYGQWGLATICTCDTEQEAKEEVWKLASGQSRHVRGIWVMEARDTEEIG